jgi:hypothetical protein
MLKTIKLSENKYNSKIIPHKNPKKMTQINK